MNAETATKLRKRATVSANRMGFIQDREDLAQEVICRMLEGRNQHSTIDQATVDAIRQQFGDSRAAIHDVRKAARHAYSIGPENADRLGGSYDGVGLDDRLDFERAVVGFRGVERAFILLRYLWGMSEAEIGNIFGVSESRICQRLSRIQERLSARNKKEARRTGAGAEGLEDLGKNKIKDLPFRARESLAQEESRQMESSIRPSYQAGLT